MEKALVSAATGALGPVIGKLAELLEKEYMLFKDARRNITVLKSELEHMHAFLERLSWFEDPNVQAKLWTAEVRELSYDIEDSIDEFMLRVDGRPPANLKGFKGFISRITNLITKIKTRCRVAKEIQGLKELVKEAGERRARYKIDDNISSPSGETAVDSRVRSLYKDQSELVGTDGPKDEIVKLLTEGDDVMATRLRGVSIVGPGGLGKTTLANQVYNKLGEDFKHRAFVSVSRNPNMMNILRNIHRQVIIPRYMDIPEEHTLEEQIRENAQKMLHDYRRLNDLGNITDEQQLMTEISNFLKDKRYFVVIDDIWDVETWETISCLFCQNGCGSRIITTTRIKEVAESSCSSYDSHVYELSPLGNTDSKRLFISKIFGSKQDCPSHLQDISNKILTKCNGLPLAIIAIAGLLANKAHTENQWNKVEHSIGHYLERDKGVKAMIRILSLSYFDLPHHLKSCLLYLSIFPEKYAIEKKSLVRRWIAEGFIPEEHGYTQYQSGERCFHELINRSLVQAVDTNAFGEVKTCQVHDIILDFIVSKSAEDNFVTIYGVPNITQGQFTKVRRLSIKEINQDHGNLLTGMILSHARTVTVFGKFFTLPHLSEFRILRVLDIQDFDLSQEHDRLTNIGILFQLKYLCLKNTKVHKFPEKIEGLQSLETLNLRGNLITELPASIVQLGRLASLLVDGEVKLPDGTGNMLSLQELRLINVSKQPNSFWVELSKLTNLRKLSLSLEPGTADDAERCKEYTAHMVSSICKIGKLSLHSLSIAIGKDYDHHFLQESWNPPPSNLSRIVIKKEPISRVPNWIGSSLVNLQQLYLSMEAVGQEDVSILGSIPALLQLVLYVQFEKQQPNKKEDKRMETDNNREKEKDAVKEEMVGVKETEVDKKRMVNGEEVENKKAMLKEENVKVEEDIKNKTVMKEVEHKETMDDIGSGSGRGRTEQGKEMAPRQDPSNESRKGETIEQEQELDRATGSSNRPRRRQTKQEQELSAARRRPPRPTRRRAAGKKHEVAPSNRPQLNINASHGFPLLRYLKIDGTDPRVLGLEFGVGSMPKLEELVLMFKAAESFDQTSEDLFFGIKNLSHLVNIKCEIDCFPLPETTVEVLEDAIRKVVRTHPNHPRLTILKRSLNNSTGGVEAALLGLIAFSFLFIPFLMIPAMLCSIL